MSGLQPHGGEEITPKTTASPLPALKQGPLGSAFQTNRRESFHQRDLEEKMVHKVTMDTVKIITSAVSGMTNVSEPRPPAHWAGTLKLIAHVCMAQAWGNGACPGLCCCFSHSHCL